MGVADGGKSAGALANQSLNRTDMLDGGHASDVMLGLNGDDVMDGGPGDDIRLPCGEARDSLREECRGTTQ